MCCSHVISVYATMCCGFLVWVSVRARVEARVVVWCPRVCAIVCLVCTRVQRVWRVGAGYWLV